MAQQVKKPTVPNAEEFTQEAFVNIKNRNQDNITMSLEDIARTLLTPSEIGKCYSKIYTATLFNRWTFHYGPSAAEHWQKAIGRDNQNVCWSLSDNFEWSKARKLIMRKYGFAEVNFIGKKSAVVGLRLKSVLTNIADPEPHLKRIGTFIKDFKTKTNNNSFLDPDPSKCLVQTTCNPEYREMLIKYTI